MEWNLALSRKPMDKLYLVIVTFKLNAWSEWRYYPDDSGVYCLAYSHLENERENYLFLMISVLNKMTLNLQQQKNTKIAASKNLDTLKLSKYFT